MPVAVVLQVLTASTVPEPTSPPIQVPLSGPPPVSPVRVAVSSRILPVPDAVAVKRESSLSVLPVRLRIQATRAPATATALIRCPADSSEPQLPVFGPLTSAPARVEVFQVKSLKQFVGANAWVAYTTREPSMASAVTQPATFLTTGADLAAPSARSHRARRQATGRRRVR